MKRIKHIGRPIYINYDKQQIIYQFEFIEPDQFKTIEEISKKSKYSEISIRYVNDDIVSQNKIKCWYGSIGTILRERGIIPDADNVKVLDKQFRETIFPVKYIDVGLGDLVPDVPSIHDLSNEEFGQCINTLHERHSYIDWDKFKL